MIHNELIPDAYDIIFYSQNITNVLKQYTHVYDKKPKAQQC